MAVNLKALLKNPLYRIVAGQVVLPWAPLHGGRVHPAHPDFAAHGHAAGNGLGHTHGDPPETAGRMIRSAEQLETLLCELPVSEVRVRRSMSGFAVRFVATRASVPALNPL